MGVPTWYFDGDKKRVYEVPPLSSYVVDGNGYRIYTPDDIPSADKTLYVDIKKDLWSRWVDWQMSAKWSLLAIAQSGGALRGYDQFGGEVYQSVDFTLMADDGWRIVLADYDHETIFNGNLYSDSNNHLFDNSRLTTFPVPRLSGAADLLTYVSSGGGATAEEIAEAVMSYERV
jgi:hypothetical protein